MRATLWIGILVFFAGCCTLPPSNTQKPEYNIDKIQFSLDAIQDNGLREALGAQTSVAYEFCVPADVTIHGAIKQIDPSVKFYTGASGRIGCSEAETLCIGDTHQEDWRAKLLALSALPYVHEIRECYFE